MTLLGPLRRKRLSPSLLLAAFLVFVAACETTPARPPAPISSGAPRTAPGTIPPEGRLPLPGEEGFEEGVLGRAEADDGYTPLHMSGRDVRRAAVLLPFSHPRADVRAEAESMLAGIELAMFNRGEPAFVLLPKDTAGVKSTAEARAREALEEGADIIIGPLFSANVQVVRDLAYEANVPVVAFSNSREAAGGGSYLISISPEEEVIRIVDAAFQRGVRLFAYLGPSSDYGRRIEAGLRMRVAANGGRMVSSGFYSPSNDAPVDEARQVATAVRAELESEPRIRVAVMIPEGGVKLRSVAPLLPYYDVDIRRVQLLGTGLWNDPSVWREPTLIGGIFPAPDPASVARFSENFERIYSRKPTDLASIGYDAGALAAALATADALSYAGVTQQDGFSGVNGLFRFRADGTAERSLAVLELKAGEGAVPVELGRESFDDPAG